jgi:hypothetical protein
MTGSTISTLVAASVTLGTSAYPSPLTITSTGGIGPAASSAIALVASIAAGAVLNQGTVTGGGGTPVTNGDGGAGGVGVFLSSGSSLTNAGGITGGAGGQAGSPEAPGGGVGVQLTGGSLANGGAITGGGGGLGGRGRGGAGGAGVVLGATSVLTNTGVISGGAGNSFQGPFPTYAGGGAGVDASNSTVINR